MAQHRYRQNKIKREHTIIDGVLPILEGIAEHPHVQGITPGRINKRSSNRNVTVTYQYKTDAGLKLLARSTTAVQEVFVVTDQPDQVLEDLAKRRLIKAPQRPKQGSESGKSPDGGNEPGRKPTKEGAPRKSRRRPAPRRRPPGPVDEPEPTRQAQRPETDKEPDGQTSARGAEPDREETASTATDREATDASAAPDHRVDAPPKKRPEVGDAIDHELQAQLMSMARKRAGAETPARAKPKKKATNVWRDLARTHRALLALEEPPHDLDER